MSFDYALHLFGWALPVLALQWAFNPRALWKARRVLALAILAPSGWLSAADAVAIRAGIWRFDPAHLTGLRLGPVPLEEVAFFLVTSTLVAQAVVLFRATQSSRSASPWGSPPRRSP